jgi:malate dehydrogenase (oxaloacetate-decarboxylating)(NADP+)
LFFEADHLDVLKAAQIAYEEGICHPILLGSKEIILEPEELGFMLNSKLLILKKKEEDARRNKFATIYWESRKRKGISL